MGHDGRSSGIRVRLARAERFPRWREVAHGSGPGDGLVRSAPARRRPVMPTARLIRILARLAVDGGTEGAPRLCTVCAEVTDVDGAGIMLLDGDRPQGSVCTSDDVSTQIEELQYTLGEGPCIDAHRQHVPVIEPDL